MSESQIFRRIVIAAVTFAVIGDALGLLLGFGNAATHDLILWSPLWAVLLVCVVPSMVAMTYSTLSERGFGFWFLAAVIATSLFHGYPLYMPLAVIGAYCALRVCIIFMQVGKEVRAERATGEQPRSESAPSGSPA